MDPRFNEYSSSATNEYSSTGSGGYPTGSSYGSSIGGSVPSAPQQYVDYSSGPVVPPANSYSSTVTPNYYNPGVTQTQTSSNLYGSYNARVRRQQGTQQIVDSKYDSCCRII